MEVETLTRSIICCATIGAAFAIPNAVAAQGAPEQSGSGHLYGIGDDVLAQLNLAKDQQGQVQGLQADLERDLRRLFGEHRALAEAFQRELTSWDPNPGELRRLHNKLARILVKIDERGFDFLLALIDILSEQQRRDLVAAMNGHRRGASDSPGLPSGATGSPLPPDDPGSQGSPPPPPTGDKKPPSGGPPPSRGDCPGHQALPPAPKTARGIGVASHTGGAIG